MDRWRFDQQQLERLVELGRIVGAGHGRHADLSGGDGNDIVLTRVPAPPATLTSATILTNGPVVIAGQGIGAVRYTLEAATNLTPVIQWTLVGQPLANSSGQFSATDTNAALHPVRFYRAVSP